MSFTRDVLPSVAIMTGTYLTGYVTYRTDRRQRVTEPRCSFIRSLVRSLFFFASVVCLLSKYSSQMGRWGLWGLWGLRYSALKSTSVHCTTWLVADIYGTYGTTVWESTCSLPASLLQCCCCCVFCLSARPGAKSSVLPTPSGTRGWGSAILDCSPLPDHIPLVFVAACAAECPRGFLVPVASMLPETEFVGARDARSPSLTARLTQPVKLVVTC